MKVRVLIRRLSIVFFCLLGCTSVEPKMLPGNYCLNENMDDCILLEVNHTYKHTFVSSDKKRFENRGKWHLNSAHNQVIFEDFEIFDGIGVLVKGNWEPAIETTSDQIRLMESAENEVYYFKKIK